MSVAIALLVVVLVVQQVLHSRERRELTQRLQAPEQAIAAYARQDRPARRSRTISLDDDKAMLAARERRDAEADED